MENREWDTEEFAKNYCKMDSLVEPQDFQDMLYFLKNCPRLPFMSCDSVEIFSNMMGNSFHQKCISIASAIAIMDAIETRKSVDSNIILVAQKWCVIHCFTPWLLHSNIHQGRFSVGLCYYGNYGDAPPTIQHIPKFVHKVPMYKKMRL